MSIKNCVPLLIYFSEHIVWARYRKPLKTLLVTLRFVHEFGLICMFVIASFLSTLNSDFFLVYMPVNIIMLKTKTMAVAIVLTQIKF